jgi:hypothetical protein
MATRYTASYSGLGELMKGPEMQAVMQQVAEKAMGFAIDISPERTGEYKSSFEVTVSAAGGPKGDRAEAQLMNTSDHAVNVEWQDNYHVLGRTLDALGSL